MTVIKNSYGIILVRISPKNEIEVLIVQRRTTYAFDDFVLGAYRNNRETLIKLFNNMTVHEKHIINSCNFEFIWYHFRPERTPYLPSYNTAKNKFESRFTHDRGKMLRHIINDSKNRSLIYEFPKGRCNGREKPINCAVREFGEETGIAKSNYKIIPNINRTLSITTMKETIDVKYIIEYYFAITTCDFDITLDFKNQNQISEVSDIRWVPIKELMIFDKNGNMGKLVSPFIKYIQKLYM